MSRKPWQVWLVFFACLAIITSVMLWLSVRMVGLESLREIDRTETEVARRDAVLQERISAALYRMDLLLIPLVSEESARPHQHYQTVYFPDAPATDGKSQSASQVSDSPFSDVDGSQFTDPNVAEVSPLYEHAAEFVKLHFEVLPDDQFVCPQVPSSLKTLLPQLAARLQPLDTDLMKQREQLLAKMESMTNYDLFQGVCRPIETSVVNLEVWENGYAYQGNSYEVPAIDRAVDRFNYAQQQGSYGDLKSQRKPFSNNKLDLQVEQNQDNLVNELGNRRDLNQGITQRQQAVANASNVNRAPLDSTTPQSTKAIEVIYGVMQPVWVQGNLLLVRPLQELGETRFQCCWLDWSRIQAALRSGAEDLLPMDEVQFEPIEQEEQVRLGMALTTLPVQLSMDREQLRAGFSLDSDPELKNRSSAGTILSLAWSGFLLSAIVAGFLLQQVVSLSERRANFVSAVTHELRTPLTTFRMYSEMLASDMVPPEKQKQYVGTLQKQANRLSHLVENVLQFARLESHPDQSSAQAVQVGPMLDRFVDRLQARAAEEEFKFSLHVPDDIDQMQIKTRPVMIEQVLFNLVDNACKYGKPSTTGEIELRLHCDKAALRMEVSDGGPGVEMRERGRMFQPFHKSDLEAANSEPGVGLGLALCKRMAFSLGGKLSYRENESGGATFELSLPVKGLAG
ncbi:HAMP domain-containing histidine kinase [Mariniblastus sp.]|nr:HAMP domain-containing histidine kinase [Mariniblastus sp.]